MPTPPTTSLQELNIGMLRSLDALLRERSVSKAAKSIGVSQPSMSNALARLRLALNDPLLLRSGGTMVLSNRGIEISERVSKIIAEIAKLEIATEFEPATSNASFRIALTDYSAVVLMPHVIARVRAAAPSIRLTTVPADGSFPVTDQNPDGAQMRMHWIRDAPPSWYTRRLLTERMVVIGRKGHPALSSGLTLDRFLTMDQVALSPNRQTLQTRADFELQQRGFKRRVSVTVAHFASLPSVVRETDLIALFPRRLVRPLILEDVLDVVEPPLPFDSFTTSLAWEPRYHEDPAHRWLRELIADVAIEIQKADI